MRKYPLSVLLFLLLSTGYTQNRTIDSLQILLQTQKEDTSKVNILNALSYDFHQQGDFQKHLQYAKQALDLAEKLNFKKGIAVGYLSMSDAQGTLAEAIKYLCAASKYFEDLGDKLNIFDNGKGFDIQQA